MQTSRGESCEVNGVSLNWENSHYVHTCRGKVRHCNCIPTEHTKLLTGVQGVPEVVLRRTSDHAIVFLLESNAELWTKLQNKGRRMNIGAT